MPTVKHFFNAVTKDGNGTIKQQNYQYNSVRKTFKSSKKDEHDRIIEKNKTNKQEKKLKVLYENEERKVSRLIRNKDFDIYQTVKEINALNTLFTLEFTDNASYDNKDALKMNCVLNLDFFKNSSKNFDRNSRSFYRKIEGQITKTCSKNQLYPTVLVAGSKRERTELACLTGVVFGCTTPLLGVHPSATTVATNFLSAEIFCFNKKILLIKFLRFCLYAIKRILFCYLHNQFNYNNLSFAFKNACFLSFDRAKEHKKLNTAHFVISLDAEWKHSQTSRSELVEVKSGKKVNDNKEIEKRKFSDFLSQQFVIRCDIIENYKFECLLNFDDVYSVQSLESTMNLLIMLVQDDIKKRYNEDVDFTDFDLIQVSLFGYFGGVDLSSFKAWDLDFNTMIVLNKHMPFTDRNIVKSYQNKTKMSISYTDIGNLTSGNLSAIGESMNMPKIDTEKFDVLDGFEKGFYKSHMDIFRQNRPQDFYEYSVNDSRIVDMFLLEYCYSNNIALFSKIPCTISSKVSKEVINRVKINAKMGIDESILDTSNSFEVIKTNVERYVKYGYVDLFNMSCLAFSGGYNIAFQSCYSLTPKHLYALDLSSAYSVASVLMPRIAYNDCIPVYNDLEPVLSNHNIFNQDYGFELLYGKLKGVYPNNYRFIAGAGLFDVKYPEDFTGIISVCTRYDNKPVYSRTLTNQYLSWIDVVNAYEHGADVRIIKLDIPIQDFDELNSWSYTQLEYIRKRITCEKLGDKFGSKDNKLSANQIFGICAQGIRNKNKREYSTNEIDKMPINRACNPLLACCYTAYTRYLITLLRDLTHELFKNDMIEDLHITTDGYAFFSSNDNLDLDLVNQKMIEYLSTFYSKRLSLIGYDKAFKIEGKCTDLFFNLRTRFYGDLSIKSNAMSALTGVKFYSLKEVYDCIRCGDTVLDETRNKLMNLTDMKHSKSNKHRGVMYVENIAIKSYLNYDFARKISDYVFTDDFISFTTENYKDVDEYIYYRKFVDLMKLKNLYTTEKDMKNFLFDLENLSVNSIKKIVKTYENNKDDVIELCNDFYKLIVLKDKSVLTKNNKNYYTLYRNKKAYDNKEKLSIPLCLSNL